MVVGAATLSTSALFVFFGNVTERRKKMEYANSFAGSVAIITGGGDGIGLELALNLVSVGQWQCNPRAPLDEV